MVNIKFKEVLSEDLVYIPVFERPEFDSSDYDKRDVMLIFSPFFKLDDKTHYIPYFDTYEECRDFIEFIRTKFTERANEEYCSKVLNLPEFMLSSIIFRIRAHHKGNKNYCFLNFSKNLKIDPRVSKTQNGIKFLLLDVIPIDSMKRLYDGDGSDMENDNNDEYGGF